MGGLTDLGAPTVELSGRTPLRLWVVRAEDLPDKGHFIPTRIPGIWVVVAPLEEENDGYKGNGGAPKRTAASADKRGSRTGGSQWPPVYNPT